MTAELSVVIPAYNSAAVLARTIDEWRNRQDQGAVEVIIVENGSTDDTWSIAQERAKDSGSVKFVLLQSEKGMGNALRAGIAASTGRRVLLTADDMPFGFDDLDGAGHLTTEPAIVIGSKAHRDSQAGRGVKRAITTLGFRTLRRVILGSRVGDSQGTLICDGKWLRRVAPHCQDSGFLFSTEIAYAAELAGLSIIEVPVRLRRMAEEKASSVHLADVRKMGMGLIRMRRERGEYRRLGAT
jgi:glycosyltransferase involved in cell wall biosynthesis